MSLACERFGSGPELLLVHGWAMSAALLRPWAQTLAERWRVTLVELPGHGASHGEPFVPERLVAQLSAAAPAGAVWLGWSLGATLALRAQIDHGGAGGLLLLAATPRFCRCEGWSDAVDPEAVRTMRAGLDVDPQQVVDGFLRLSASAGEGARALLRELRRQVQPAEPMALKAGLDVLLNEDLRTALPRLGVPAHWLVGDADPLVPVAAVEQAAALSGGTVDVIAGAGHYPFISHPQRVAGALERLRPRG